jgi:hypothetical protein
MWHYLGATTNAVALLATTLGDQTMNHNLDGVIGFLLTMGFVLMVGLVGAIGQTIWNLL